MRCCRQTYDVEKNREYVVAAVNGRTLGCKKRSSLTTLCSSAVAHLCTFTLLTQSNDASTEPHHEFGPRAVCLLLGIARTATSRSLLKALVDVWWSLNRNAIVTSANQAIFLLVNLDVGVGALRTIILAGGAASVTAFDLSSFLLCPLLIAGDLFPGSLLFFQSLLFCKLSAGFLDALSAWARNSFTM